MTSTTLRTPALTAARDYQNLPAWQKSLALAEKIYSITDGFPTREHSGLAREMRLTAIEVSASLAAASGRNNEFGMTESYSKAQSATAELTTMIALASRLDYLDAVVASSAASEADEVNRHIAGLKHGLKVAAKDEKRAVEEKSKYEREANERSRERERPRRDFKNRDGGEERPRREYKPRDGADERPRREYKPRDGGEDRPRRDYKPREDRGERKPYGDKKPYGDRKPYGDKKPYGDRKPYGEKKPYGDRKPRGDKPFRKPRDQN